MTKRSSVTKISIKSPPIMPEEKTVFEDKIRFVSFWAKDELKETSNICRVVYRENTTNNEEARSLAWKDFKNEFGEATKYFAHEWTV